MNDFFTVSFWFNRSPGMLAPTTGKLLLGIIIFFLLLSVVFFILKNQKGFYRPLLGKFLVFFATNAAIGAVLYFFRQQIIPFLSSRIWSGLWLVGMIAWVALIIRYAKELPDKKRQLTEEREFKKYLP
jgi:hypothetical protein